MAGNNDKFRDFIEACENQGGKIFDPSTGQCYDPAPGGTDSGSGEVTEDGVITTRSLSPANVSDASEATSDGETKSMYACKDGEALFAGTDDQCISMNENPCAAGTIRVITFGGGQPVMDCKADSNAGSTACPFEAEANSCVSESQSATNSCNADKNDSILTSINDANRISSQVDNMTGGALIGSCNSLLQMAQGSAASIGLYKGECGGARTQCISKCSSVKNNIETQSASNPAIRQACQAALQKVSGPLSMCESTLKGRLDQADQNIARLVGLMGQAKNCQTQFSGLDMGLCMTNPSAPGCGFSAASTDCNDPTAAATNPVCICVKNPMDPSCGGSFKTGSIGSSGVLAGANGGSGLDSNYNSGKDISKMVDAMGSSSIDQGKANNGSGEDPGGRKGGGANIDSGGSGNGGTGSGGGDESYAGGGRGTPSGFRGGGGGGGGGSWGPRGSASSSGRSGGSGVNSKLTVPGRPDLNQFRPNMNMGRRNLAGVVGPDGLLGPHANIWVQVQNRYHYEWQNGQLLKP